MNNLSTAQPSPDLYLPAHHVNAQRCTFNNVGRDQHNTINIVINDNAKTGDDSDVGILCLRYVSTLISSLQEDPDIDAELKCTPHPVVRTTTLITTNMSTAVQLGFTDIPKAKTPKEALQNITITK